MSNIASLEKLSDNTLAEVKPVNSNFEELRVAVNDNDDRITDLKTSLGGVQTQFNSQLLTLQEQLNEANNSLSTLTSTVSSLLQKIIPDYANGVTITSGWTATSTGWVNWNGGQAGDNTTRYLYVNGVIVGQHTYYKYGDNYRCQFLVSKGDVITFGKNTSAKFFPCKGDV